MAFCGLYVGILKSPLTSLCKTFPSHRGTGEAATDVRASDADVAVSAHVSEHPEPAVPSLL